VEIETVMAAIVPIIVSAVAYGAQSKEVERLRSDLETSESEVSAIETTHRENVKQLFDLHREQEREIASLRQGHERMDRFEGALARLDQDSRVQGNQVAELSVKMGMVFDEMRTLKHGVNELLHKIDASVLLKLEADQKIDKILGKFDEHKKESDARVERVLLKLETQWTAK